jgi:hypothetical protein
MGIWRRIFSRRREFAELSDEMRGHLEERGLGGEADTLWGHGGHSLIERARAQFVRTVSLRGIGVGILRACERDAFAMLE